MHYNIINIFGKQLTSLKHYKLPYKNIYQTGEYPATGFTISESSNLRRLFGNPIRLSAAKQLSTNYKTNKRIEISNSR
jgi:hypothetical protein